METNLLKNRILGQVGYVDFPETVIENTIVMLQQPHRPAIYAQNCFDISETCTIPNILPKLANVNIRQYVIWCGSFCFTTRTKTLTV